MLWGAGTAVGEIPPYAFSYHAAKAGIRNEEWDSIFAVRPAAEGQGLLEASINRMKSWMLGFIQTCAPPGAHDKANLRWWSWACHFSRSRLRQHSMLQLQGFCCALLPISYVHHAAMLAQSAEFGLQRLGREGVPSMARRHGFWGIFLLAAWPNALFDLCGICCGHFLMPFWQFFGATLAGKAIVKV